MCLMTRHYCIKIDDHFAPYFDNNNAFLAKVSSVYYFRMLFLATEKKNTSIVIFRGKPPNYYTILGGRLLKIKH